MHEPTHQVEVLRTSYGVNSLQIQAPTRDQAVQKAIAQAGDLEFRAHAADYSVAGETIAGGRPILSKPLTPEEVAATEDKNGYVTGIVTVTLEEVIEHDREGFLDLLTDKLIEQAILSDISYKIVGHERGTLLLEVTGEVSSIT